MSKFARPGNSFPPTRELPFQRQYAQSHPPGGRGPVHPLQSFEIHPELPPGTKDSEYPWITRPVLRKPRVLGSGPATS